MAPRKRKAPETSAATPVRVTRSVARSSVRVTRSAAKRAGASVAAETEKKGKKPKQKKQKGGESSSHSHSHSENQGQQGGGASSSNSSNTIVIEHSTQGNAFKTRATEVKQGLEGRVPGINVIVNPKKPRKGCFEIRAEGGEKFISLLKMKRPFKRLKELDVDKVISDIIDKIN